MAALEVPLFSFGVISDVLFPGVEPAAEAAEKVGSTQLTEARLHPPG
jgi:hypothetical protein